MNGEGDRYLNRELSHLCFIERVLALAEDDDVPALERAKYLAFVTTQLDEFFQVRVAGLKDQLEAGLSATSPDGITPAVQLKMIREQVLQLISRQSEAFARAVLPTLVETGVHLCGWDSLSPEDRKALGLAFEERIFPVLTPLAVDPGHPFPYISDLSLSLAITIRDPYTRERRFARVKVPPLLPRFVVLPESKRFVPLEQVIAAHLERLFPGVEILGHYPFRITRNGDLVLEEEEAEDLLEAVELELRNRRSRKPVRLEVDPTMDDDVLDLLCREMELAPEDVYVVDGLLDLSGLFAVHDIDLPELKDPPWAGVTPESFVPEDDEPADIFAVLREGPVLVHHPYDSFSSTVEAFITRAAADPDVLAIKQTLYRTSGDSAIVRALARAAESGKQVAVLVEVKARGDERTNIVWAKTLEEAGAHVVYGLVGLKTHNKTALVVRREHDGLRRYCHIGTGNYNSGTARSYEDLGLLTSDAALGADLTDLFNSLTGFSRQANYRKLIVAPLGLRSRMLELIAQESAAGSDGRIILKMNGLDDPEIIEALYGASACEVPIDLIIRGICSLRPGVDGLSENIRVRSIVGRFLEHSRIYHFGSDNSGEGGWYIGSADLRRRNLDRRVEVLAPVEDAYLQDRLRRIVDSNLADTDYAWHLQPDGRWRPPQGGGLAGYALLQEDALARAGRR